MAVNNFIPTVWSARVMENLRKFLVYAQAGVVNRDYEGDIRAAGDSVKINAIGAVTVGTYTKNTNISDPETLTDAQTTLLIDQNKYFNFAVDRIDQVQANPKWMDAAMAEAAYALRDTADQYVAGLYTGVAAANVVGSDGTPVVPSSTTAYAYLVDLSVLLTDARIPKEGRWVIVPPWFYGRLLKDARFVDASASGSTATLRNGQVGMAAGFAVLESHNVPNTTGTKYKIIAGHPMALTYAEQIVEVTAYQPQLRFGDAIKGLHVYGAKLIRNTGIAVMTANTS